MKFSEIKAGDYFKFGRWFYQKCDTNDFYRGANAICLTGNPSPKIVSFHGIENVIKTDKDGNEIVEKFSWSNCPVNKWVTCDNLNSIRSVYVKNINGLILNCVKGYGLISLSISFGESKCWSIVPRPEWVKLPD